MKCHPEILSDPWFNTKGLMNDEELNTPAEVEALKLYLAGALPAEPAARAIMTMDESQIPLEDKVVRICWILFDASMDFVARQDDILDLQTAITEIPDEELGLTEQQKARYPNWRDWKWLCPCPSPLSEMIRAYEGWRYWHREDDTDYRDCYRRWRNVSALVARYEMRHKEMQSVHNTVSIISEGLESEPWKDKPDSGTYFPGTIEALDADIPAAAIRLILQGPLIYDFIAQNPDHDKFKHPTRLWSGDKPGLSMERWGLWKARLLWAHEQVGLDQETRDIALQAHIRMGETENPE